MLPEIASLLSSQKLLSQFKSKIMAIKKLKHITQICKELYEEKGASAVYEYANERMNQMPNGNVSYKQCAGCEAETPHWHDTCLICGS